MAINYPNFLNAPVQNSGLADLLPNVLKGFQMQREPAKMAEEQKQRELANQLKQIEVETKPAQLDLERRYKESLIEKANALAKAGGSPLKPTGDFLNYKLTHPDSTPEEERKWFDEHDKAKQEMAQSLADRRKQIRNSAFFTSQPAKWKDEQLALAAGLGMDPAEASKAFINEGKTFSDLAKEKGIEPTTVQPVYPTNNENIKQTQIRTSLIAELINFEKNLADIQGKYSRKFFGYSPKQITEALKNENPDEQGMILAARNLAPEIAAVRAKIATNGTIGIEALKELNDKALGNLKIFEPLVSEEAKLAMVKYTDKLIMEANQAYTGKMQSYSQIQPQPGQAAPQAAPPADMIANALANPPAEPAEVPAPQIPSWVQNSADFQKWKATLKPEEVEALRKAHIGG